MTGAAVDVDPFAVFRIDSAAREAEHAEADRVACLELHVPDISGLDVLAAALKYAEAGWYVLPVKPRSKNPGSVVGAHWQTRSTRDPKVIAGWFAGCPAGTGIALHLGRSGAMAFDVDNPERLPEFMEAAFIRDRPPFQQTRPNVPGRGHYLYLMPTDRVIGNSLGGLPVGWGDVRGHNGVIIVQPTVHAAPGGLYFWEPTGPVALPAFPEDVGAFMDDAQPGEQAATDAAVATFLAQYVGGSEGRARGPSSGFASKVIQGSSRHAAVIACLTWGMKEARAGLLPAKVVADTLRSQFLASLADPAHANGVRPGGESEFEACLSWAVGQALAQDEEQLAQVVATANRDRPAPVPVPGPTQPAAGPDGAAGTGTPEDLEGTVGATWEPMDLSATVHGLMDGTLHPPTPTVGAIDGGGFLFYAGKVNGIAGESGCGKSWTALVVCRQEVDAGQHVLYIDLEDDPVSVVDRLLKVGTDPQAILAGFHYIRPDEPHGLIAHGRLVTAVEEYDPSLIVIDSTGESMALDSVKPNDDDAVARWFRHFPTSAARLGPAVLVLDHVVKSDGGGLWPIGSQRKRAAISGTQYMQTRHRAFSKDVAGSSKLTCAKDRQGAYRYEQHVANLTVTPRPGHLSITLTSVDPFAPVQAFRPTRLMQHASTVLAAADKSLSGRQVTDLMGINKGNAATALAALVAEGFARVEPGARGAIMHELVRPYREADDPRSDAYVGEATDRGRSSATSSVSVPVPLGRGTRGHSLTVPGGRSGDGGGRSLDGQSEDRSDNP